MWDVLDETLGVMDAMANGVAERMIYVSTLDPGVGKSQAVVKFIDTLLRSREHMNVGAIICLSRLAEIAALTKEMVMLPRASYAVLTSDESTNDLGQAPVNEARVLFTTQAQIERRCRDGKLFADVKAFHFQDRPRLLRVWDEAYLPGRGITLNRYDLSSLLRPLRGIGLFDLASTIEDLFYAMGKKDDGDLFEVPDFETDFGSLNYILGRTGGCEEAALTDLWLLSGKLAAVRHDGRGCGNTILDYHDENLPPDIAPMLVLDASARPGVRSAYDQWEAERGGIKRLRPAPKRYDALTVNVWNTYGGKRAFEKRREELIDGVVQVINSKPTEEFLVVGHKAKKPMRGKKAGDAKATTADKMKPRVNIEDDVRERIEGDKGRVKFLTWGSHTATNEFVDIPNVILAGTLFYRASYYDALGRLVTATRPGRRLEERILNDIELGEHRHLVLQALCRGRVRKCDGDACLPCEAYIIAANRTGIPAALPDIFPGCKVKLWRPIKRDLRGKVADAFKVITEWFDHAAPDAKLRFVDVQRAIDISDTSNFREDIRKHPDLVAGLSEYGIREDGRGYIKLAYSTDENPQAHPFD
jgi:hypothetical protein